MHRKKVFFTSLWTESDQAILPYVDNHLSGTGKIDGNAQSFIIVMVTNSNIVTF